MKRVVVDPVRPDPTAIAHAAMTLKSGGVVAIPTDTLYGLAADPWNPVAVARVFAIKGRQDDRALPLVAADIDQVRRWIGELRRRRTTTRGTLLARTADAGDARARWPGARSDRGQRNDWRSRAVACGPARPVRCV